MKRTNCYENDGCLERQHCYDNDEYLQRNIPWVEHLIQSMNVGLHLPKSVIHVSVRKKSGMSESISFRNPPKKVKLTEKRTWSFLFRFWNCIGDFLGSSRNIWSREMRSVCITLSWRQKLIKSWKHSSLLTPSKYSKYQQSAKPVLECKLVDACGPHTAC